MVAVPVRGDRMLGIISLGMPEASLSRDLLADLEARCDAWSRIAQAADEEEALLETEAWRSACLAANESVDHGLAQVVTVLADAARFLPRKGNRIVHHRGGGSMDLPAPRDGLEPHRQSHLPGEQTRPAMMSGPTPPPALHSMMDVPVLQGGVLLGHVQFARSAMHGCFTARHLEWAQEFAKAVAFSNDLNA